MTSFADLGTTVVLMKFVLADCSALCFAGSISSWQHWLATSRTESEARGAESAQFNG